MTDNTLLRPLPCRRGFLIGLRETVAYLLNPDRFIATRAEELGPVFGTTLFFRPTAVVGGPPAVEAFLASERTITESSLPAAFTALHTPDGALNQSGVRHRATRAGYQPLFQANALERYLPVLTRSITGFTDRVAREGHTHIARDGKLFCLNLFAELFAGEVLSQAELEAFNTYNAALLSLSTWLPSFRRGIGALTFLQRRMMRRLERFRQGELTSACFNLFASNRDEKNLPWSDERIVTATILLIWGAYIEVASLMASTLILSEGKPDVRERILLEAGQQGLADRSAIGTLPQWTLPYTQGVVREALRLNPPAGGGFRLASDDVAIAGFRIPAGTVITADPRIGNRLPSLYPEPDLFEPERWIQRDGARSRCPFAGSAAVLPRAAWFPGGIGSHSCPGIPLAELCGRIFLVRWMQAIHTWRQPNGSSAAIPYTLVPIKIPSDSYRLLVEAALH
ncbi:MAG: cytochrome P450 [Hylemonella sp.]